MTEKTCPQCDTQYKLEKEKVEESAEVSSQKPGYYGVEKLDNGLCSLHCWL